MRKEPALSLHTAERRFEETGLRYATLEMGQDGKLVVLERGGRIFPFIAADGGEYRSILWANPAFGDSQSFEALLKAGEWNLGGERLWIAPEMQYAIKDRKRLEESYELPKAMDPGSYRLSEESKATAKRSQDYNERNAVLLSASFELHAYNLASGTKLLETERRIKAAPNPLRELAAYRALMEGLSYAGYEHYITLTDLGSRPDSPSDAWSETWTIMQLHQGGTLTIPLYGSPEYSWYYEPQDPSVFRISEAKAELDLAGGIKFKVGFKAPCISGRAGYLMPWIGDADSRCLIVRNFYCNPSGTYREEPFTREGDRGYPFHVYNADGSFGCFGELECNGQAVGPTCKPEASGTIDESTSFDRMVTWIFTGSLVKVLRVRKVLLGI
ncbi:MAG TPA: hypothetical protein PLG43_14175 [Spirochaetia bacterium]|nr:hypothetical protein [Spirochaetia bacterium]